MRERGQASGLRRRTSATDGRRCRASALGLQRWGFVSARGGRQAAALLPRTAPGPAVLHGGRRPPLESELLAGGRPACEVLNAAGWFGLGEGGLLRTRAAQGSSSSRVTGPLPPGCPALIRARPSHRAESRGPCRQGARRSSGLPRTCAGRCGPACAALYEAPPPLHPPSPPRGAPYECARPVCVPAPARHPHPRRRAGTAAWWRGHDCLVNPNGEARRNERSDQRGGEGGHSSRRRSGGGFFGEPEEPRGAGGA